MAKKTFRDDEYVTRTELLEILTRIFAAYSNAVKDALNDERVNNSFIKLLVEREIENRLR